VWVWGFWFGFALRRVALLCGVFVQLHLALFPAGGPFLPSLYVTLYSSVWGAGGGGGVWEQGRSATIFAQRLKAVRMQLSLVGSS
jgi:hypothetical protein